MMRRLTFVVWLIACLLLTGCGVHPTDVYAPATQEQPTIPAPADENARAEKHQATLWFRFGQEPLLAAERRAIEFTPPTSYETALLTSLIGGPSGAGNGLTGLFPPGTRLLSTQKNGRTLFVTLSREVLGDMPDEPDLWRTDPRWAQEVPLRRALAMQSIAATVTENCPIDRVVILVEQGDAVTDSLRLRQGYYRSGGDENALADDLLRDESLLLTPQRTAEVLLQCWQERDFLRLARYLLDAPDDAASALAGLPHLVRFAVSGGSVQGTQAVFTVEGAWLDNGTEIPFRGMVLRLTRMGGVWRIAMSELDAREVVAE